MAVAFLPRFCWKTLPLLLPKQIYGVAVPAGLSWQQVRAPNFVNVSQMQALLQADTLRPKSASLPSTKGLVTKTLSVALASPTQLGVVRRLGSPTAT